MKPMLPSPGLSAPRPQKKKIHELAARLVQALMQNRYSDEVKELQAELGSLGDRIVYEFDIGAQETKEAQDREAERRLRYGEGGLHT